MSTLNMEMNMFVIDKPDKPVRDETCPIQTVPASVDAKTPNSLCCNTTFFKVDKQLIKFKAFFFFFGGAIGSVFPYFSIYYKQMGFSPNQIGIISGVRPLVGFCSGPIWGSLADRFRIRRILLIVSALGWLAFVTSIGFVPPAKYSDSQCNYVKDFIGATLNVSQTNQSSTLNESQTQQSDVSREDFDKMHIVRKDNSPIESLMESRGWMFDSSDLGRAFTTIIALVVLGELLQSPCGALADSGCIDQLGDTEMHKYGHQRAWGSLGLGVFSMSVGAVISFTRKGVNVCGVHVTISDYHWAFYFFAGSMFCCLVTTFFFKFQKQADDHVGSKPKPNPLKVFRMFLTLHYGSWLFSMFFTGICNGVIWGFLFWHLENIGGTQLVLGLANGVSLASEMVMFLVVFRLLEKTGCLLLMVVGMTGYSIRFMVFALIDNAWLVLPFEVLQGATFAGVWSVYIKYLCSNVPAEYLGTLQGFLHGVYWGLGAGSGSMIGGISVEMYGARVTFWIFAVASFVNMIIFLIIQKCTVRPNVFGKYEELNNDKT